MPFHQSNQLSPISIAIDCLSTSKFLAMSDNISAMETATQQLRQSYYQMAQQHLQLAEEWFHLMQSRGWYQVPPARQELLAQLQQQLQTAASANRMPSISQPQSSQAVFQQQQ